MSTEIKNPYVGPRTYTREESDRFFGRDTEARELLSLVISERLVLFYAQSGAGKSSLLHTRLAPQLAEEGFLVLPIARVSGELPEGVDEVDNIFVFNLLLSLDQSQEDLGCFAHMKLVDFLANLATTDGKDFYYEAISPGGNNDEDDIVDDAYEEPAHVLIIDQFEEILTTNLGRWSDRADFFRQLDRAMRDDPLLWVVLTMREDHVAALDPYAPLLPNRLQDRYYMQRMGHAAALEAIRFPAEQAKRPFTPEAAQTLVDNLRQIRGQAQRIPSSAEENRADSQVLGQFVEPVHLQVVCYQLWENLRSRPASQITEQDLQELGNVDQALTSFYEDALARVLEQTGLSERRLRSWFDTHLITLARTRGLVYRGDEETEGLPNEVIDRLTDAHVIRADIRGGATWYELTHDRLVEPILEANLRWEANYYNPVAIAYNTWLDSGRQPEKLLRGEPLIEAQSYAEVHPAEVTDEEQTFLADSARQTAEEAEQARQAARRQRNTAIATIVVMIALGLLAFLSWRSAGEANRSAATAEVALAEAEGERVRAENSAATAEANEAAAERAQEDALTAQQKAETEADIRATAEAQAKARQQEAVLAKAEAIAAQQTAEEKREEAEKARAEAVAAQEEATQQQTRAEKQDRLATARGLATAAMDNLETDPELSILLAMQAVLKTYNVDQSVSPEAVNALHRAIQTSRVERMLPHDSEILSVAFHPAGTQLVTAGQDGTVRVWDPDTGTEISSFLGHEKGISHVVFSPDGTRLATAGGDGAAKIWDAKSGQELLTLTDLAPLVLLVAFSPDSTRVATADYDETAEVWDVDTGQQLLTLMGHTDKVSDIVFNFAGTHLATGSADGKVKVWDAETGQELLTLPGHERAVRSIAFSPDDTQLVTSGWDKTVKIWDADTGQELRTLPDQDSVVLDIAISPDGARLATASRDRIARLWDVKTGQRIMTLSGHSGQVNSVAFSPDGARLATGSGDLDNSARIWDSRLQSERGQELPTLLGHQGIVYGLEYNSDGSRLVTASQDKTAKMWDADSGQALQTFSTAADNTGRVFDVTMSSDGQRLVTAHGDGKTRIWDVTSGEELSVLSSPAVVHSLALSPDETHLATAHADGTARVWNMNTGEEILLLPAHSGKAFGVAFSPDGRDLATTGEDGTAKVWDAETGEELWRTFSDSTKALFDVTFSSDSRRLVTVGTDKAAIWDIVSSRELRSLSGHNEEIHGVAFSPDGKYLATASKDRTAKVWDAETGEELWTFPGHTRTVTSVAFSPDGARLATASGDGAVRQYILEIEALLDLARKRITRPLTLEECQKYLSLDECPVGP